MLEMTVESVRINLQTEQRVVILKATKQERYLFIWIAHAEAYAIAIELQGTISPRPLTHDLFINLMNAFEIKIVSIVVSDLVDDIFYTYMELEMAGRHVRVDARPSDAIAIAVRARIPIYVEDSVLERAGVSLEDAGDSDKSQNDKQSFQSPDEESSASSGQPIQDEDDRVQELSQEEKDFIQDDRDRFDKFTERARKVLSLAQEEAQRFQHTYIGTEHLLLGLVRESEGVAAKVLRNLGVELNRVRSAVEFIVGRGDRVVRSESGLTPRAKKVIELAVDEARRMNHHYIGTEHLLLGLVREGEGIAAGVLESLGVNLEKVRTQTIQVLNEESK
jgi:bifunctional DNase/RNase